MVTKTTIEGGVKGVRKPQNRTKIRQKTANRIGFFPNTETAHTGRPTIGKLTPPRLGVSFATFASTFISAVATEIVNIRAKLNLSSG